jgi:TolB-like protein/DNA-binding winged helix-turn-helix (wHTH) protein
MIPGFRLSSWLVEPSLNTVSRNGTIVHLEPKVMGVLVCLAEHGGDPVPKEKLLQAVWPDTFVSDGVLVRSISELRRALEDEAKEPRVIQTISKGGYRLIAPVERLNGNGSWLIPIEGGGTKPEPEKPVASRQAVRTGIVLGVAAVVLLVGLLAAVPLESWRPFSAKTHVPVIRSIAVLPMKNLSGDPEQKYFAEGMTEELITDLSQISSLKVISRTSSEVYEDTHKPLPQIARELNVDAIVEGSLQRSGDRVHITAQLIYAPEDKNIWAQTYERDLQNALTLQSEVAAAIVGEVRTQVTPEERARLHAPRPVNLRALDAYLQGTYHLNRKGAGFGDDENRNAEKYFQESIVEDPGFAPAYRALAITHTALILPSTHDHVAMKAAVEKALSLEPSSAEGHALMATVKSDDWDWSGAEEEYRRAIVLGPNNLSAHLMLGYFLDGLGRMPEAMNELQRAQELDPNEEHLSEAFAYSGEYDRAIALKRRALEIHPDDGYLHYELSDFLAWKGDYSGWVKELERMLQLFGFPELVAPLDDAFTHAGYRGAMKVWAADIERLQAQKVVYVPLILAETYTGLGDKDRAFYWLEDAYSHYRQGYSESADGGMRELKGDPWFIPIHSDPRFKDLLRRVGLPP